MKFVNVYNVTRRFGGHEEGGWYYNNYDNVETFPARKENTVDIVEFLEKQYKDDEYGDINSIHGGLEVHILVEDKPGESQTVGRPQYE